jgi:tRNA modification GTPase
MPENPRSTTRRNVSDTDTIAAIATPLGKGALHVVRLSGLDAKSIASAVFKGAGDLRDVPSHTAHYGKVLDSATGEVLDDAIAVTMWKPKSYTREDSVEFTVHGSRYIAVRLVASLIAAGARMARPGEFTFRAFMNGRIDLSQAEAVADLIDADTELSHRVAVSHLAGNLSNTIQRLRSSLLEALTLLEAYTDFPEEDIEDDHHNLVSANVDSARSEIETLLSSYDAGRILRNGLIVPIVGPPNAGKSSLFNYLLDHERTIVSDRPGTTRDSVSEMLNIGGLAVELIDTAGIHATSDPLDAAGVERSRREIESADLLVCLIDGVLNNVSDQLDVLRQVVGDRPHIVIATKIDAMSAEKLEEIRASLPKDTLYISSVTGEGIDQLLNNIARLVDLSGDASSKGEVVITSLRHRDAFDRALSQLDQVSRAMAEGSDAEIVSFELRQAINELDSIVGRLTPDDVLEEIFSRFCIGK